MRYQELFHEMFSLPRLRFQLTFFLFSFCATTISTSSRSYDGKNRPGQREEFLNNLRYEENEMFLKGPSPRFAETLMPFLEEYEQPSKEKLEKEDLTKPDKRFPSLDIYKAGVSIVHY